MLLWQSKVHFNSTFRHWHFLELQPPLQLHVVISNTTSGMASFVIIMGTMSVPSLLNPPHETGETKSICLGKWANCHLDAWYICPEEDKVLILTLHSKKLVHHLNEFISIYTFPSGFACNGSDIDLNVCSVWISAYISGLFC